MVHAAASSQGLSLQIRQSLIAGIGLSPQEKEEIAPVAAATGKLPVYNQLEELRNEEWIHSRRRLGKRLIRQTLTGWRVHTLGHMLRHLP